MASPNDAPDLPDLDQFAARIEEAANATEQFASTLNAASAAGGTTTGQQAQPNIEPLLRDLLSAIDLVHSELQAFHETVRSLTE